MTNRNTDRGEIPDPRRGFGVRRREDGCWEVVDWEKGTAVFSTPDLPRANAAAALFADGEITAEELQAAAPKAVAEVERLRSKIC